MNKSQENRLRDKLNKSLSSKYRSGSKSNSLQADKILQPHLLFKNASRLSLKSDSFFLFEYVEENPLILSSFGMASRLERVIYPSRVAYEILSKNYIFREF